MAKAKGIVKDLFKPNPFLYWTDFLFYDLLGWAAFILAVKARNFSIPQLSAFVLAGFALYRSVLFVHELSHLKKGTFRLFHLVWNLLCGFPLTIPSFLYAGVHTEHHKTQVYGTKDDPEYFPFALAKPYRILLFPLTMGVAPAFFLLRFLVVAPVSYFFPALLRRTPLGAGFLPGGGRGLPAPPCTDQKEKSARPLAREFMTFAYLALGFTLMAEGILPPGKFYPCGTCWRSSFWWLTACGAWRPIVTAIRPTM